MRLKPIQTKTILRVISKFQHNPAKTSNGAIGTPKVGKNNSDNAKNHGCCFVKPQKAAK